MKYPNGLELPRLRQFLKMSDTEDWTQDWDLILANEDWIEELLSYYENEPLNNDEKNILMQLIIASYDDKLNAGKYEFDVEKKLISLLKKDIKLHAETFAYWARLNENDDGWNVTPMLRKVWFEQEKSDRELESKKE